MIDKTPSLRCDRGRKIVLTSSTFSSSIFVFSRRLSTNTRLYHRTNNSHSDEFLLIKPMWRDFFIFLLLAVFGFYGAAAQKAQPCSDSEICANEGRCSLASPTFLPAHCSEDEFFFNRSCYHVYESPLSWDEAKKICESRGSHLTSLQSKGVQRWMSILILKRTAASSRALRNIGFWTAGHSVLNGTNPAFVWMPNNYLIEDFEWYYGQPNIYENNSDICIVLRAESDYRQWHSQTCSDLNFFVCSRDSYEEKNWNLQCQCKNGYKGRYCETENPNAEVSLAVQSELCENEAFEFSCISGGVINVDYAFFGNDGTSTLPCTQQESKRVESEPCSDPFALITLTQRCQGLRYCQAKSVRSLFPNSVCRNGMISYRLRCSDEPLAKCPKGTIYIQGRCYAVHFHSAEADKLSWSKARKNCLAMGGDLAGPINRNVHNILRIDMTRKNQKLTKYWIGFQTESANDSAWINGLKVRDFVPPNSTLGEQVGCGYYESLSQTLKWSTGSCEARNNWVCEFSPLDDSPRPTEPLPRDFGESRVFTGTGSASDSKDLFGEGPFCSEVTWQNLHFPKTRACAEAVVRCPDENEVEGFVTFKCDCESATWPDKPNTNNCTHKWIGELVNAVHRKDPVVPIADSLAQELDPNHSGTLFGGDIVGSVDIHSKLLPLAREQLYEISNEKGKREHANNFTKFIGLSGDHLLSSSFRNVWNDLDKKVRITKASSLMRTLEESAILLATFISGNEEKLGYKNWAMEIEVHRPEPEPFVSDDTGRSFSGPITPFTSETVPAFGPMNVPQESPPVSFSSFSKSPVIRLPSFSVLQSSSVPPMPKMALSDSFSFAAAPAKAPTPDRNSLRLGYYLFTSIGSLLTSDNRTIVNSHVIGASVNDPTRSVSLPDDSPATFTFYHIHKKGVANPRCVFWDADTMLWSENGCFLTQTNDNFTDCSCNHLTSFAILMDITGSLEGALTGSAAVALDFLSIIGCALSSIFLVLAVLVFSCFRSLWNVRNTIHRNLCISLLVAELLFAVGINRAEDPGVCRGIAVALHYFFLSAFTWMLLEGYQLYLMLIQVFEPDKTRIIVYYAFGYGLAAVVVAISAGISWEHYGTANYCWIDVSTPTIWAFVAPITVVIVINVVFLFLALKVVLSVRSRDRTTSQRVAGWLKGSATLLCLLGITWVFGYLIAVTRAEPAFAYIFTILNSLQGFLIFVLHVVLNEKVRLTLVRFFRRGFCCAQDPTSSYNSKSFLSSKRKLLNILRPKDRDSHQSSTASSSGSHKSSVHERTALDPEVGNLSEKRKEVEVTVGTRGAGVVTRPLEKTSTMPSREMVSRNTAERQRTAPVRRKKFPLGATVEDRKNVDNKETEFIERF
ncbi:hypothetical protein L596_002956 [Steinernema carpocapsae]|uniref:Latrophilin-3 n=1 Tax=Steinernema carpocapsae TaxID=34508 RepID=A0A4U8URM9_STECR|nr:hypothetical protein L596_002956 [Steinernema carpocapsae]